MISRADFNAYNEAVSALTDGAAKEAERQISSWIAINPDASVADIRDFAKETLEGLCQVYGEAAASLAAEWYDTQAVAEHAKLPDAITEVTYSPAQIYKVVHYQAQKLVDGDMQGFASACGEYLENNVKESLNNTIIANAKRDKSAGVRFARVTTGAETCSFCYMLASRGAVYHSRQTAGEFNHYHRRCDCKVVPGFEDDSDSEIVEGYDPKGMRDRMALIEEQTGLKFGNKADMSALSQIMKLHDSQWLLDGTIPDVDYSLNPRENYGTLLKANDYSEENIVNKGQEWRDLYAIDTLQKNGLNVSTRPNNCLDENGRIISQYTTPDLLIGNTLWEIKSPRESTVSYKPGNELKFIDNQFKEARHNFLNPFDPKTKGAAEFYDGKRRVVLNLKYRNPDFNHKKIVEAIKKAMKNRGISEVIYINHEGELTHIKL